MLLTIVVSPSPPARVAPSYSTQEKNARNVERRDKKTREKLRFSNSLQKRGLDGTPATRTLSPIPNERMSSDDSRVISHPPGLEAVENNISIATQHPGD